MQLPALQPDHPAGMRFRPLARLAHWLFGERQTEAEEAEPLRLRSLPTVSSGGGDAIAIRARCDGYYRQVEARLEQEFEQFLRERISLDTYRATVTVELDAARERLDELSAARNAGRIVDAAYEKEVAEAKDALAASQWCLDWADGMERKAS